MRSLLLLSLAFAETSFVSAFFPLYRGTLESHAILSRPSLQRMFEQPEELNGEEADQTKYMFSSAAAEWKKQEEKESQKRASKKFAVVGGGWGGWGAAKALCEAEGVEVTLLDALPDPTGKTPFLSKTGKPGAFI